MSSPKYVAPAIDETAFNCPHCGAFAKQHWLKTHAHYHKKDDKPTIFNPMSVLGISFENIEDEGERDRLEGIAMNLASGRPFLENRSTKVVGNILHNVSVSDCFNCNKISIWIYNKLVWPRRGEAPNPNPDLPDDVRVDYDEAGTILDLSPRGAAALMRLAIQKLCKTLGGKGKNLDQDIAALVEKGLDERLQKALDVVRVVGNNAVHPGQIDLKDDRATAETLFGLINLIAERMISEDKHIDAVYQKLPKTALEAIVKRDGKSK